MTEPIELVKVFPDLPWMDAKVGKVVLGEMEIANNIPIKQIKYTTAKLHVKKGDSGYNGIIYLNEQELPKDNEPIELPLETIQEPQGVPVTIKRDIKWGNQNGVVILFEDKGLKKHK
jgi:hypothetical protein